MKTIHVDIVSAEGEIYSGEAKMVYAPARMGEVGIAPRHAPLLTALKPGEVRVARDSHNYRSARNWLVPVVLSSAFVLLFTVANPVISQWIGWLDFWFLYEFLWPDRLIFWGLIVVPCWAFIRYKTGESVFKFKLPSENLFASLRDFLITPGSITRGLIIFNALFLVQTCLDVIYLWGGKSLPSGLTYADYAHRGAYPLIAVALLAGAFVLIALR